MKKLVPYLIGLTYALLLPYSAAAQGGETPRGSVRGTVRDAATQEPVPFAQVIVEGSAIGTLSDSAGVYRIERVPAGYRSLKAASVGYREVITPAFLVTVAQESVAEIERVRDTPRTSPLGTVR